MANNGVSVHLANLEAALVASPPRRLVANLLLPPLRPRLPLVLHHVLESHSIDGPQENRSRNLLPRGAIVQNLVAVLFVPLVLQQGANGRLGTPVIHKGRTVGHGPEGRHGLAHQLLQVLGNRHAARNRMGIHNHVGHEARGRPRHVVAPQKGAGRALLAVAIRVARPLTTGTGTVTVAAANQKDLARHPNTVHHAIPIGEMEPMAHNASLPLRRPTIDPSLAQRFHHHRGRQQSPLRLPSKSYI